MRNIIFLELFLANGSPIDLEHCSCNRKLTVVRYKAKTLQGIKPQCQMFTITLNHRSNYDFGKGLLKAKGEEPNLFVDFN